MATTLDRLQSDIDEILPGVIADRRHLHQHPELGYQEHKTAAFIVDRLRGLGITDIRTGVGQTGIVALIHGKTGGKVVALRADMDALPIQEENEVDYCSTVPGTMHACGHDAHVAMLLGAARMLQARRDEFTGTVKLLFQPAEEGGNGALAMVNDGALENPKPDAVFGLHIWQGIPLGEIHVRAGLAMLGADFLGITVRGAGGHGAQPHLCVDPVAVVAQIITALQTVVARESDPLEPVIVTIGAIHGGEAPNVIPDVVELKGTIRFGSAERRTMLHERITAIATGIAASMRATAEVTIGPGGVGPTINDAAMAEIARAAAEEVVGADRVSEGVVMVVSEDMSEFLNRVPGCYFFLGSRNEERGLTWGHHTARFDIDEDALASGVEALTRSALRFLESDGR